MEKQIAVTKEDRKKLEKIFNVTERTVFKALSAKYGTDNGLHKRIRKTALENGGIYMETLPMMETFHDADGTLRNYLPNGAVIEFYRVDNTGHIFFKGEEVDSFENVTISKIYEIQAQAAALR